MSPVAPRTKTPSPSLARLASAEQENAPHILHCWASFSRSVKGFRSAGAAAAARVVGSGAAAAAAAAPAAAAAGCCCRRCRRSSAAFGFLAGAPRPFP